MLLLVLLLMLLFMLILHAYVMLLLCLGVGRDAIPALELIESDRAVSTGNSHGAGAHRPHSTLSYSLSLSLSVQRHISPSQRIQLGRIGHDIF